MIYSDKYGVAQYKYSKLACEVITLCEAIESMNGTPDAQEMLVRTIAKLALASIELEQGE